jgi:hypothetical protein
MACVIAPAKVAVARAVLVQFEFRVGGPLSSAGRPGGRGQARRGVAFDRHAEGVLDRAEPGCYPLLAGGDGLAVSPAVGALWHGLAEPFYLADVGFSLVGVSGHGEHGDAGGVQDQGDCLALGIAAGHGDCVRSVDFWPGLPWLAESLPGAFAEPCQHHISPVDLIAGPAEVLIDRAELVCSASAVLQEPGRLRLA